MSKKGSKRGNKFIIEGDIVKMELRRYKGENLWTTFSITHLERVKNFPFTWHSTYDKTIDNYYVKACFYEDDENGNRKRVNKPILLHMFLMNPDGDIWVHVDHINHNTLDNTDENLRVTEASKNARNRCGANSNNKTGYRNVSFIRSNKNKPYYVQLMVNGKNVVLGKFSDVDEAGIYAKEMRKKYYGKYRGKG